MSNSGLTDQTNAIDDGDDDQTPASNSHKQ